MVMDMFRVEAARSFWFMFWDNDNIGYPMEYKKVSIIKNIGDVKKEIAKNKVPYSTGFAVVQHFFVPRFVMALRCGVFFIPGQGGQDKKDLALRGAKKV